MSDKVTTSIKDVKHLNYDIMSKMVSFERSISKVSGLEITGLEVLRDAKICEYTLEFFSLNTIELDNLFKRLVLHCDDYTIKAAGKVVYLLVEIGYGGL